MRLSFLLLTLIYGCKTAQLTQPSQLNSTKQPTSVLPSNIEYGTLSLSENRNISLKNNNLQTPIPESGCLSCTKTPVKLTETTQFSSRYENFRIFNLKNNEKMYFGISREIIEKYEKYYPLKFQVINQIRTMFSRNLDGIFLSAEGSTDDFMNSVKIREIWINKTRDEDYNGNFGAKTKFEKISTEGNFIYRSHQEKHSVTVDVETIGKPKPIILPFDVNFITIDTNKTISISDASNFDIEQFIPFLRGLPLGVLSSFLAKIMDGKFEVKAGLTIVFDDKLPNEFSKDEDLGLSPYQIQLMKDLFYDLCVKLKQDFSESYNISSCNLPQINQRDWLEKSKEKIINKIKEALK